MKKVLIAIILQISIFISSYAYAGITNFEHRIQKRNDGGYSITISGTIQHLKPITAEGIFPKQNVNYKIELIGEGENFQYRNQPGFYYPCPEKIKSKKKHWDLGYVWVDEKKDNLYINLYWVDSPDSLKESDINGKYKISLTN